jgi:Cellulase (glycosyl hydrolase family 5)
MGIATPLSTRGRFIVDANGRRVRLAGVNWIGAHMDDGVAPGLDRVPRGALAKTIARLGFNCVRFPFSVWMTRLTSPVPDRYLAANPDLYGSTPLQVYDACVAALTCASLIVIPNCHMLSAGWCCANDDRNDARPGHEPGDRADALRLGSAGDRWAADRGLERRGQPGDHGDPAVPDAGPYRPRHRLIGPVRQRLPPLQRQAALVLDHSFS